MKDCAWYPDREEKNVEGPFYTVKDGCLACALPEMEAPTLLAQEDENYDTYFIKQPKTEGEIEQACKAIEVCCINALRYGGKDVKIIARLGNDPEYCDYNLNGDLHLKHHVFWGRWYERLYKVLVYWYKNSKNT